MNKAIRRLAVGMLLQPSPLPGCASWPGTGVRVGETRISDDAISRVHRVAIQDIRGAGDADATEVLQTAASGFALGEDRPADRCAEQHPGGNGDQADHVTVSPALFASPDVGPLIDGIAECGRGLQARPKRLPRPTEPHPDRGQPRYGNWSASQAALTSSCCRRRSGVAGQSLNLWPISTPN